MSETKKLNVNCSACKKPFDIDVAKVYRESRDAATILFKPGTSRAEKDKRVAAFDHMYANCPLCGAKTGVPRDAEERILAEQKEKNIQCSHIVLE